MNYLYYSRGRCLSCNQIMWNTTSETGVVCQCNQGILSPMSTINIGEINDDEFIAAIKSEYPALANMDIYPIKI